MPIGNSCLHVRMFPTQSKRNHTANVWWPVPQLAMLWVLWVDLPSSTPKERHTAYLRPLVASVRCGLVCARSEYIRSRKEKLHSALRVLFLPPGSDKGLGSFLAWTNDTISVSVVPETCGSQTLCPVCWLRSNTPSIVWRTLHYYKPVVCFVIIVVGFNCRFPSTQGAL